MNKETIRKSDELLQAIAIAEDIVTQSAFRTETEKKFKVAFYTEMRNSISRLVAENKLVSASIRSGVAEFLTYWNESVGLETELFWQRLKENGIDYKRKEPLRRALDMGRFRNVHEGMEAAKNFPSFLQAGILVPRYSNEELNRIGDIIQRDTAERVKLLKDCLKKKAIPSAKYLRFGDSVAYLNECRLWENHFTAEEVKELMEVWRNVK